MAELPEDVAFPAIFEEELLPEEEPFARDWWEKNIWGNRAMDSEGKKKQ
jgi:hypothetical protein